MSPPLPGFEGLVPALHLGCRKWTATICGLVDVKAKADTSQVMAIADSFEESEDSRVTAIVELVTCPGCLAAIDRALELGYSPKPAYLGPRSDRSWYWRKARAPKPARQVRIARPSSVAGWLDANGFTLANLQLGEPATDLLPSEAS